MELRKYSVRWHNVYVLILEHPSLDLYLETLLDLHLREHGYISKMLNDQGRSSLQDRKMAARLMFFYKIVEELVSAISPIAFIKPRTQYTAIQVYIGNTLSRLSGEF